MRTVCPSAPTGVALALALLLAPGTEAQPPSAAAEPTPLRLTAPPELVERARRMSEKTAGTREPRDPARKAATPGWTTILYEDAEGNFPDDNGWLVYDADADNGDQVWHPVDCKTSSASTGSHSLWAGPADDPLCSNTVPETSAWMLYGPFDLSDALDARIEFLRWVSGDKSYDYLFWGVSVDGETYDGFYSTYSNWATFSMDLTELRDLGDVTGDPSVWFVLFYRSDSEFSHEGAYVDDILIEMYAPDPTEPPGAFELTAAEPTCLDGAPWVVLDWTRSLGSRGTEVLRDGAPIAEGMRERTFGDAGATPGATHTYVVRTSNDLGTTDSNAVEVPVSPNVCLPVIRVEPTTVAFGRPDVGALDEGSVARSTRDTGPVEIGTETYDDYFARQTRRVRWSGEIVGEDGAPLSGTHPVEVRYFGPDDPAGTPSFVETFDRVEIDGGTLALTLGAGEPGEPPTGTTGTPYASLEGFFREAPEATMEIRVGERAFGPRVGLLPAGHSLESRLVARGERTADAPGPHWKHYRAINGATATQATVLSPTFPPSVSADRSASTNPDQRRRPMTLPVVGPVSSRPVADLPRVETGGGAMHEPSRETNPLRHEDLFDEKGLPYGTVAPRENDALVGRLAAAGPTPPLAIEFPGIGNVHQVLPPDPEAAVGPHHFVQAVNTVFAIFDKTGRMLVGPTPTHSLWAGFGGPCETDNSGDPIFLYDQQAGRFVLTQMATDDGHQSICFAVSQTSDPTGAYHLYEVVTPRFPDYVKMGVWSDPVRSAYFFGTNSGAKNAYDVFAVDRRNMLAGAPARPMQFFQGLPNLMMPADVDGPDGPPPGSPGLFYTIRAAGESYFDDPATDSLDVWEFHVDWDRPASSTLTLARSFTPASGLAEFNWTVCGLFVQNCIPQPHSDLGLDSLSWWPMQRLVYRNFGSHQTLVGSWTVDAVAVGDRAAPRWFELRDTGAGWFIHQQGTHSPDAMHRWMSSIAMDGAGNIALGYSRGDASTYPSIQYTVRSADDPVGTLREEAELFPGGYSQPYWWTGRWGDYSSMEIDPVDDCTFWYTAEVIPTYGDPRWATRVGAFSLPDCQPTAGSSGGFTVHNDGGGDLDVTSLVLDEPADWFSWTPQAPFTVPPGASQRVAVTVDLSQAPDGASGRRLVVTSNDGDLSPYPDAVYLDLDNPRPPTEVTLADDTIIEGDPVEACGTVTLGPDLRIEPPAAGLLIRAPRIVFLPPVEVAHGGPVTFDDSPPVSCPP